MPRYGDLDLLRDKLVEVGDFTGVAYVDMQETADVQEVVCCKDCKYWIRDIKNSYGLDLHTGEKLKYGGCKFITLPIKENFYCRFATVKESKALADTVTNKDLAYGLINLPRVTRTNLLVKFELITNEEIKDDIPHVKIIQKIIDRVDDKNCRSELMQKIREA